MILEEINRSGANSGACHAQMYIMGTLLRHGSAEQKQRYLPKIASGELRLQSFAVTEPTTGTDTTRIKTFAERQGDRYMVNGQKVWISRVQHSDLMLLLARTTPLAEVKRKTEGLSVFLVDLRGAATEGNDAAAHPQHGESRDQRGLLRQFRDSRGEPDRRRGQGLPLHPGRDERRAHPDRRGVHRRRLLVHRQGAASTPASAWCSTGRSGRTRASSFRIARAYANVRAADLMRYEAARLFDAGEPCGAEANIAKLLAADASWEAANVCLQTHGGFGFAAEYDVERKFRETRLYQVAPVSTNLILVVHRGACAGNAAVVLRRKAKTPGALFAPPAGFVLCFGALSANDEKPAAGGLKSAAD